jgi:transmembrane sensor
MTEPNSTMLAESHEAIEARAADFLQRRLLLRWSATDQAEFNVWLDEATSHRVTFLRLEAGVARIEKLSDLRPARRHRLIDRWHLRFAMPILASAVSLGFAAVLGFAVKGYFLHPVDHTYSTEVGGRALLRFADRTQIELNTDTVVRYRMTTQERTIWLDKGEAWFRVTHNAADPFTVIVGNHRVTDLGTEFFVRSDPGRLEVALLKGRAQLSTAGDRPQFATLTSGDEAVATPVSISFAKKTPQQLADELGWQRGMLVFHNARFGDAVREFNRYSETKLVIADPAIADLKIGGGFKTDDLGNFLRLAQAVLKLRVDREGNDILISRESRETTTRAANGKRNP